MVYFYRWQGRHLLREQCGIYRNDTIAEVKMVLCLTTNNKQCVIAQVGWIVTKIKTQITSGQKLWSLPSWVWSYLPYKLIRLHCFFQNSREGVIIVDCYYQFTDFQNKYCLILVTGWRSGNTFAWYFECMNIFIPEMYPSFKFHCLGSERWRCLKGFPTSYKTIFPLTFILGEQSILLSGCLSHASPKMTLFSGKWQSCISIVIEYTLQGLVRCLFLLPQFCMVYRIDVCRVCQQIDKISKNKFRPGLEQHYCIFFVLGQWRWIRQP